MDADAEIVRMAGKSIPEIFAQDGEDAFRDCINTIRSARQATGISTDADLLAFRNKLMESKGTKA